MINTIAVVLSSEFNTISKLTPSNLTSVILPQFLTTTKEDFKIQVIELQKDIIKSNLSSSNNVVVVINSGNSYQFILSISQFR